MRFAPDELMTVFRDKYGDPATGPVPRRCVRFGYFFPDEYYEALLDRLVTPRCRWLDVGGGRDVLPENPRLSQRLADRCGRLVAVDPSPNVRENPFAHERVEAAIESYTATEPFDLLTLRMVAEHIERPNEVIASVARLLKPGGRVVVYTVNKYSPVSVIAWAVPFRLHHPLKRLFWRTEERDTFPVVYRLNTRKALGRQMAAHGLVEDGFSYLDDCRTFFRFGLLNGFELATWRVLKQVGLSYPETCLLGVYRRG